MDGTVGLSLLSGSFESNRRRCLAFLTQRSDDAGTMVIACKPARYAGLRSLVASTGGAARLLPIADPGDFRFFLARIDCLCVDEPEELRGLLDAELLSWPVRLLPPGEAQ